MTDPKHILWFSMLILVSLAIYQHSHAAITLQPVPQGYNAGRFKSLPGSFSTTAANDGYIKPTVVNVAGNSITVPAKLRIASNDGTFVKQALRLNPLLLGGTIAAAWLLEKGMEWSPSENQWKYGVSQYTQINPTQYGYISPKEDYDGSCSTVKPTPSYYCYPGDGFVNTARNVNGNCQYWCLKNGTAPPPTKQPATNNDWNNLPNPLPALLPELPYAPYMPDGVPVQSPVYDFAPFQTPLGLPYTKPDGSRVQPMASVSPNHDRITVDTYDKPLTDPNGNPIQSPTPQDTPETLDPPTQCDKYPDSLGCSKLGTVDEHPLQTENRTIAEINPVNIGELGSCPAPLTTTFMGQPIAFKFDLLCQYAIAIRPIVLAIAWLTAGYIFVAGVRQ